MRVHECDKNKISVLRLKRTKLNVNVEVQGPFSSQDMLGYNLMCATNQLCNYIVQKQFIS